MACKLFKNKHFVHFIFLSQVLKIYWYKVENWEVLLLNELNEEIKELLNFESIKNFFIIFKIMYMYTYLCMSMWIHEGSAHEGQRH